MNGYKSNVLSIRNVKDSNKPNEDAFICDDKTGIYLIVDGVSRDKKNGIYPNPSPAADVSRIFVNSAYEYYKKNHSSAQEMGELLFNMFRYGNMQIDNYNKQKKWENDFLPGTVGIAVIIKDRQLFYAYIGDCYGFIIHENKKMFTRCQTEEIAKHKSAFDSKTIRNIICNNKNHLYSYGVLNGDIRALDFFEYGTQTLNNEDKILLCTDGFYDALRGLPAQQIYNMTLEQIEKFSTDADDKTLIIIERETK